MELKDLVPAEYATKPYMEKIKDVPSLFKAFDGAQSLIGSRTYIPGADASEDQVSSFYKALAPDAPEKYELKDVKLAAEEVTKLKGIFKDAGLSPFQAQKLAVKLAESEAGRVTQAELSQKQAKEKQDKEFEALVSGVLGDKKDQALANAKALVERHAPASLKDQFSKLDNNTAVLLAAVLNDVHGKYVKEDVPINAGGGKNQMHDLDAAIKEVRVLMGKTPMLDPSRMNMQNRLNELYKEKVALESKT